MRLIYSSY